MPDTKPSLTTIVFMQVKTLFPVPGIGGTVSGNMESHNTTTPSRKQPHMFQRQNHNTSFVAYSAQPSKKPQTVVVDGKELATRIHPDVFINEYTSVKIKSVTDNGETANIVFDASTVVTSSDKKMKYDFGANIQSNTDLHKLATEAYNQGAPVYVALETRRRYKTKNGEIVPLTTPIHKLRGCKDGPQSAANSSTTGENCSKIIAAMGWAEQPGHTLFSTETQSDPNIWPLVRGNQDGDLAPEGFTIPFLPNGAALPDGTPLPNGTRAGGIIATPRTQTTSDNTELLKELAQLKKMVAHLQTSSSSAGGAKPWCERLGNGQINPGSYEITQIRHTRETATHIITTALATTDTTLSGEQLRSLESSLTRVLLWLADGVQAHVAGSVDRMGKSYTEAGAWVKHVIRCEDPYLASMIGDDDEAKTQANAWAKRVRTAASERYAEAVELAAEHAEQSTGIKSHTPADTNQNVTMFSDDVEARKLWDELIVTIGMEKHVSNLNPALTTQFGSHLSTQIPADHMRAALSEWLANPQQFLAWAENEWAKSHA